jgi:hypothetical protein
MDRAGKPLGTVGPPGRYRNPVLSPDGTRLAVEVVDPGGRSEDVWLVELARGVMLRFTFDPGNDLYPVWSPDGSRVMFSSDRQGGVFNLYQKLANGAGDDELMAVPIKSTATALEVGTPTRPFAPRVLNGPVSPLGFRAQHDVARDGQRFLLNVSAEDAAPPSITEVVNWPAGLKK